VFHLRRRCNGENVKKKEKCPDWKKKHLITEEKNNTGDEEGNSKVEPENESSSSLVGPEGCFPSKYYLRVFSIVLHISLSLFSTLKSSWSRWLG